MGGWSWEYEVETLREEIAELEAEAQGLREYLAEIESILKAV